MIRNDIALGNGNQRNRLSFREDVGQMYFELADLLLKKSRSPTGEDEKTLVDARAAVETLKSAELEDYFRDTCVQVYKDRNKSQSVADTKVDGTAIVYVVPLKDRIELLVQVRDHLYERVSPHSEVELNRAVRELRLTLPYVADNEYLTPAKTLYAWLIDPIQSLLDDSKIDTLVFVPDGLLRTVPMAALFNADTNKFLIEKYAIAVVPGLELMEPSETSPQLHQSVLLSGLSQAQGDFPALSSVPIELTDVEQAYGSERSKKLLNENFLQKNLFDEVRSNRYGIVHIASHGHFGGNASQTYILTYQPDKPLTLNDLEKLIRPQQYDANGQAKPIDLLVLSCCETAAGDDRAALGLAGVAIKSGARSALATLWSVNDEGSAILMSSFYHNFTGDQITTKARALQRAQLTLLYNDNVSFHHPAFWSPYLIIGNWQ
jgi:CHAT domain-containing protein